MLTAVNLDLSSYGIVFIFDFIATQSHTFLSIYIPQSFMESDPILCIWFYCYTSQSHTFLSIYLPQSSMESDPIAPLVVLPSGHIIQVLSPVAAYVSTEHLAHTLFTITVPASVHTFNQKEFILFYSSYLISLLDIWYMLHPWWQSLLLCTLLILITIFYFVL